MNTKINETVFDSFPKLKTPRLLLTNFEMTDIEMIFACRSNAQLMEYMGVPPYQSMDEAEKYVKEIIDSFENKRGISWAMLDKDSNKKIGYIAFWKLMKTHVRAEIGYWIHPDYWGKGFVSEAISKVIKFGFEDLKLHSIEACTEPRNKASRAVLEKAGFKLEAHFKENFFNTKTQLFEDSVIYSLIEK